MTDSAYFTPPHALKTPVLLLVFNRLETTKRVFDAIRRAEPPRLYIACDGPRALNEDDAKNVAAVRTFVSESVDWKCDVKTLFRDVNLGCKYAVSSAITWFYENEDEGIVLEDDCLPSQSFFWFCEELLERYKYDMRIWHISGDNFQGNTHRGSGSYYFSRYNHVWGWATWADRWSEYDVEMSSFGQFERENLISSIFERKEAQKYWLSKFRGVYSNEIDTWDYQWTYTVLCNGGLSVLPNKNLVSNIGFGVEATHTKDIESQHSKIPNREIELPIEHPLFVVREVRADEYTASKMYFSRAIYSRIIRLARRFWPG